jgi:ankyrin repeat protein
MQYNTERVIQVLRDKIPSRKVCALVDAISSGDLDAMQTLLLVQLLVDQDQDQDKSLHALGDIQTSDGVSLVVRYDHNSHWHRDVALLLAAGCGQLLLLQWLVGIGANATSQSLGRGTTALLLAAGSGRLDVVQWLVISKVSRIQETNWDGDTALLVAAGHGHLSTVQWLLDCGGSDSRECNARGVTALMWAVRNGHRQTAQWLLLESNHHSHSSLQESDHNGDTCLLWAAYTGDLPMLQWLIRAHGADVVASANDHGQTALYQALLSGCLPVVEWIVVNWPSTVQSPCLSSLLYELDHSMLGLLLAQEDHRHAVPQLLLQERSDVVFTSRLTVVRLRRQCELVYTTLNTLHLNDNVIGVVQSYVRSPIDCLYDTIDRVWCLT